MRLRYGIAAATLLLATPIGAGPLDSAAEAGKRVFHADYVVSYLGLKIARSSFTSTVNGDRYSLSGSFSSAGVAVLFDQTKGTTQIDGNVGPKGVEPATYALRYASGGKTARTDIAFSGGDVVKVENVPASKAAKAADYIPVSRDLLKAVVDPLSATLFTASSPQEVCARTLKIFDGETRADLVLSPAGTAKVAVKGYKGEAVRCKGRFVPVAGYRKSRKAIEYLRTKSAIEIAFADSGLAGLWAPVAGSIGTEVGTVRVYATRFGEN